jgi:hypothetical protein
MLFSEWRRTKKLSTSTRPPWQRSRRLRLEQLEDRTLLSNAIPLSGQTWTALGPAPIDVGFSGRLAGVAADPTDASVIYIAAAGGGVWKTTNGGGSWTPLTDNQATLFMGAITIAPSDPNTIYAGTGEATNSGLSFYGRGVLKSTDAGVTWTLVGATQFDRHTISRIVVDSSNANIVYVAVGGGGVNGVGGGTGIWKSTDGGATWNNTTTSISTGASFSDLAIDPNNSQTLFAAVGSSSGDAANGVYVTTNGGTSWALAGNFPGGTRDGNMKIAVAKTNFPGEHVVYAAIADPATGNALEIDKTTDGGKTWFTVPLAPLKLPNFTGTQGWYDLAVTVDPTSSRVVYVAGQAGQNSILESRDGGLNWLDISGGPHADHHGFAFTADGHLLDINDGGIWRLNNPLPDMISWSDINGNLNVTQFIGIALDPANANIAYGGAQDNGTSIFNNGLVWSESEGGDGGAVLVDPNNPSIVYHGFPLASFAGFFRRSVDGGASWTTIINGINNTDPMNFYQGYTMDPSNSSRLLFGTDRVYVTFDQGNHWTPISPHFDINPTTNLGTPITSLAISKSDSATIYAADGTHIQVTLTDGATWFEDDVPDLNHHIAQVLVDPTNDMVAYAVSDEFNGGSFNKGKGGHVFKTTNAGLSWTDISITLPDLPTYSIALDPRNGRLFVGTDHGVFESPDGGATWVQYMTGLPNVQVRSLELNTRLNILAAGTHGRGMWEILATPPPVITAVTITATEGSPFSGTVATFTETDGDTNFTATIDWGDGTTTSGTITPGASGTFTVSGSHTFAEEGGRVTVTVHDIADGIDGSATSASTVADPAVVLAGASGTPSVAEGDGSQSLTLATFTDPPGAEPLGNYTASINWGDGTPATPGVISFASGVFTVSGSHAYAEEGSYSVTITVHHDLAPDATVAETLAVNDPPVVAIGGFAITGSEGSQTTNQTVATFTDPAGAEVASEYSASIDWGDGSAPTTGSITVNGATFTVSGSGGNHAYSEEGNYTITVVLNHLTSTPVSVTSGATISDATVVATPGFTASFAEGSSTSTPVATFTDPGGAEDLTDYSADIDFGSGPTPADSITFSNGVFTVNGSHAYSQVGSGGVVKVTIHHDTASDVSITNSVVVADAALTVTPAGIVPVEGQNFSGTVFSFVDANPNGTADQFSATIAWGDGTSSTGTIAANTSGGFNISASHTYADEGAESVSVTLSDVGGFSTSATSTVTVADATLTALPAAGMHPVEGGSFNGVVASFVDGNPAGTAADFTASIVWGDGTTSAGVIAKAGLGFNVSGTHLYSEEGTYTVTTNVLDKGGAKGSANTNSLVRDAGISAQPQAVSAVEGTSFTGVVATFQDANSSPTASDFTASITWGDGQTSPGIVLSAGSGFQVIAQHTYAETGSYSVGVTINDTGGAKTGTTTSASVAEAPLQSSPLVISSPALVITNGLVALFTDPGGADPASAYSATINWGDGTAPIAGTILQSGNQFMVIGSHAFALPGELPVNIAISEQSGSTINVAARALVGTDNQRWIARVYMDLLGRPVDGSGLAVWTGALAQGMTRTQVVQAIQASFEYRAKLIDSWYVKYLGRHADPAGLNGALQVLSVTTGIGGDNPENFIQLQLISSPEYFVARGGNTNQGFLQALYQDVLGRAIDPGAATTLGLMLAQGASRLQIAAMVFSSTEAEQVLLERDYVRFLHRDVDPSGLQAGVTALQHGLRETALIAGLVASDEYFAL